MKDELAVTAETLTHAFTAGDMAPEEPPAWRAAWDSLFRNKVAFAGFLILFFMCLVALFPQHFILHSPYDQNPALGAKPPLFVDKGTGQIFLLGTDAIGRDLLARIVYGSRVSLTVGLTTVLISGTIGVLIGLVSGFFGGWVDNLLMRIVDIFLAFPFVLLALCLVAILKPSLFIVIVAISVRIWVPYARLVRGSTLAVREMEFVTGAKAAGLHTLSIMFKYVLPNVLAPAVVVATLSVGRMIIIEASLSFLGLGVPPPNPTWGGILADGRNYIDTAWWICFFPGLAIMLTVLSTNLLGDWFRDFIDPRLKGVD